MRWLDAPTKEISRIIQIANAIRFNALNVIRFQDKGNFTYTPSKLMRPRAKSIAATFYTMNFSTFQFKS